MKLLRIHINGWTASFRYPAFISGYQPTLPVPPLSTIYGLLSAAKGEPVNGKDVGVGYIFQSHGNTTDLEAIYELDNTPLKAGTNIVRREILFEPELYLYLTDTDYEGYFRKPNYQLLLGRSSDLASVEEIKIVELELKSNIRVGGSVFPFPHEGIYGILQALPESFTDGVPRKAVGTKPYYLVETDFQERNIAKHPIISTVPFLFDEEKNWGVYLHNA